MTEYNYTQADLDAAALLMDDGLREDLHSEAITDPSRFLREYIKRHAIKHNGERFCWA